MYCMCIHMYPSCLNIINQFDGYRTAAVRKPCFVRIKRNLKNPAKRLKLLCLLPFFCWPRKTHTQSYDYFMENYSNTLWVSLYLHCNSIIYWHFFVFDLHFSLYCNIRVLASFFLIDFCGQVFPRVDLHVHFPRFWWPHRPSRRSSIFLGTTPYCLRINCRRFTTSDSLLEGDYKKDLHCQEEAEMKVLFDIQNQFCRKM